MRLFVLMLGVAALLVQAPSLAQSVSAAPKEFVLALSGAMVPLEQRVIRVTQGDRVLLRVSADQPGQLHLHAYHVDLKVTPGQIAQVELLAHATGRFRLNWHPAKAAPATSGDRHSAPLATLEVHPR